ncbi:hypothetical protein CHH61_03900 [Shouchella clausii]|uniref:Uncharacterized protein n=1 Tax=Shouchella clausii TaxID=79880 RepID=A0A268S4J3_SHOCL|nr:hypothetical protein [Shouchella clausii]PAF27337.1 hypothetical protein CHH61_03900 [Shouchella clausii]
MNSWFLMTSLFGAAYIKWLIFGLITAIALIIILICYFTHAELEAYCYVLIPYLISVSLVGAFFNTFDSFQAANKKLNEMHDTHVEKVISYVFEEYGLNKDQYVLDKQPTASGDYIYTAKSAEHDYEIYIVDGEIIGSKELYDPQQ